MHLTARPAPGECRPVRSQGELATKERPQAVLYPQPQWWQKSGGPLPILAKAEAQAEAINCQLDTEKYHSNLLNKY